MTIMGNEKLKQRLIEVLELLYNIWIGVHVYFLSMFLLILSFLNKIVINK